MSFIQNSLENDKVMDIIMTVGFIIGVIILIGTGYLLTRNRQQTLNAELGWKSFNGDKIGTKFF